MAYALPLVEWIRTEQKTRPRQVSTQQAYPYVLIMTPTRELAIEVHGVLRCLCHTNGLRTNVIYGGVEEEIRDSVRSELRKGCDVLVATPGILLSYFRNMGSVLGNQSCIRISELTFIVYDEADLLLRMGEKSFHQQVNEIEQYISHFSNNEPLHWFFSSQFSDEEIDRAKEMMLMEANGFDELDYEGANEDDSQRYIFVEQTFIKISNEGRDQFQEKMDHLASILNERSRVQGKTLVLVERIHMVETIEQAVIRTLSVRVDKSHGKLKQHEREQSMYSFRFGHAEVLIGTIGLCGRGINVAGLTNLVLWNLPAHLHE